MLKRDKSRGLVHSKLSGLSLFKGRVAAPCPLVWCVPTFRVTGSCLQFVALSFIGSNVSKFTTMLSGA